jgi:hypothetical protein
MSVLALILIAVLAAWPAALAPGYLISLVLIGLGVVSPKSGASYWRRVYQKANQIAQKQLWLSLWAFLAAFAVAALLTYWVIPIGSALLLSLGLAGGGEIDLYSPQVYVLVLALHATAQLEAYRRAVKASEA